MTISVNLASAPTDYQVHFLPCIGGVDLAPHLVPLDAAKPGDLVAMMSYLGGNVDAYPSHAHRLEGFHVQGDAGPDFQIYKDLFGQAADHAAHLVAEELFRGSDVHRIVLLCDIAEDCAAYELITVHFADAVLYINLAWLHGDLCAEMSGDINPVVVKMGEVSDHAAAEACVTRTRRYLEVSRSMLPAQVRDAVDMRIALPPAKVFLTPGAG